MAKSKKTSVARRNFLKGAAAGAAALVAQPKPAIAQQTAQRGANATAPIPSSAALEREAPTSEGGRGSEAPGKIIEHPGSDFMVDVLKSLKIDYLGSNPGSTFESLHESLINYGNNQMPEFLTCCHEESAVAMAHGYYKIEGRPMMALLHGTVGLQHASMAIYNAYADRVPIYMVVGNHVDAAVRRPGVEWYHSAQDLPALLHGTVGLQHASMAIYNAYADRVPIYMVVGNHVDAAVRRPGVEWYHSAQDLPALVRDYVKWDDQPASLQHFADSAVRAYKVAMTPPMGPVLLVAHHELQSRPNTESNLRIPHMTPTAPPQGDTDAVNEAAKLLVAAERPMIIAQRSARTPKGVTLLVELAETLQAPVENQERMNFPSHHPLAGFGWPGYQPDVTLCLEVNDVSNTERIARGRNAKVINISSVDLFMKSNIQDFGRYADVDIDIGADAEATLPALIQACKRLVTADRKRAFEDRGAKLAEAHKKARALSIEQASYGWDSSPITLARLCAELWPLIKNEDWSLVSWQGFISNWPNRLWKFDKHYQYIGGQGAGGMGYGAPAAVGAALANKKYGRLSVSIQTDGDLNYAPGVLWTAAHHRVPLLTIMHNNRGYHMEVMFVEQQASLHNRGADRAHIGTKLWDPNIDYAKMAQAYGMHGEGPITDPNDLVPALKRGIEVVKRGEPAMIDVVTQPR